MTIQENIPLAPLTTLQVGGAARYFAEASREDDVREAIQFARSRDLPLFVLGGGSNLVVADSGWPGLVLRIAIGGITQTGYARDRQADDRYARDRHDDDRHKNDRHAKDRGGTAILFQVGAGVVWDDFVAQAVAQNCAGIECLSGIPGSVGGTPVQNVGAYGQEVADTIESVRALDLKTDSIVVLPKPACGFRYRSSIFNTTERGRYIILSVNYRLKRGGAPTLKYADLQKHFANSAQESAGQKASPSLAETRAAVREIRRSKGMLIVPGTGAGDSDEKNDSRSAGSFFKNPVLSEGQFKDLATRARSRGLEIPSYPALDAQHKVSAAWLVEHSGFSRGYAAGPAGISHKHTLAIVNRGGAKASDIVALKDDIQRSVQQTWEVVLEPEPVFVGF